MFSNAPKTSERNATLASKLREKYQSSAASNSIHASGCSRYGLGLGISQPRLQPAEHLLPRDRLHSSGANVVNAALDLFVPGSFDAFFRGFLVEAGDQAIDEQSALLSGKC